MLGDGSWLVALCKISLEVEGARATRHSQACIACISVNVAFLELLVWLVAEVTFIEDY